MRGEGTDTRGPVARGAKNHQALRDAVLAVDTLELADLSDLNGEALEDWESLKVCAARLTPLLADGDADLHELRNLAGALRGYAEMIAESLHSATPALDAALTRILESTMEPGPVGSENGELVAERSAAIDRPPPG